MDLNGYSVQLCDSKENPLPSVVSAKHQNAVFVLAKPGEPFQVQVSIPSSQKNVKAKVLVDGKDVGYQTWINARNVAIKGYKATRESVYEFKFAEAPQDIQIDEEESDDEGDEIQLSPYEPGAVLVEFYQFTRPTTNVCRFGCNSNRSSSRYHPYSNSGRGGGGRGGGSGPLVSRNSYQPSKSDQRATTKWWKKNSLNASAGEELQRDDVRPARSSRNRGYGSSYGSSYGSGYGGSRSYGSSGYGSSGYGYGSSGDYGYGSSSYGYGYSGYGPSSSNDSYLQRVDQGPTRCVHTRWQRGPLLETIVLHYETPEFLVLRGIVNPDENEEHRQLLEDAGYYEQMHKRTKDRRKRVREERRRRRRNYEPKFEPRDVIELDPDPPAPPPPAPSAEDDENIKDENKHFFRASEQEVCDLTRQDHMEVWYVKKKRRDAVPMIPVE